MSHWAACWSDIWWIIRWLVPGLGCLIWGLGAYSREYGDGMSLMTIGAIIYLFGMVFLATVHP